MEQSLVEFFVSLAEVRLAFGLHDHTPDGPDDVLAGALSYCLFLPHGLVALHKNNLRNHLLATSLPAHDAEVRLLVDDAELRTIFRFLVTPALLDPPVHLARHHHKLPFLLKSVHLHIAP
jgi:hypothetical protein